MPLSKLSIIKSHIKDVIKISWPIIVGQLGLVLTGFFDNIMVAKLGHEELAAAGICNSIFFLLAVFPMGVTISYATIVGLLVGKNKIQSTHLLVRDSFIITLLLSLITVVLIYISIQCFEIFNQEPEIDVLSKPYFFLLMLSTPPMLLFYFAKNLSDGFSYTRGGMVITVFALIINVFLNWVFIYGNLGSPAYELEGAGYATIISRCFMGISMVYLFIVSKQTPISFKTLKACFTNKQTFKFFKQIAGLGFPTGLQYFFEIAAFAFAAIMAGWLGSKELAAHQLAITIASVTYMFASGLSAGSSICVAKEIGNKNSLNAKTYGKAGHILGLSVMSVFAFIFLVFNQSITAVFTQDSEVLKMGAELLILAAMFQLGDGLQAISIGVLRGIEDVKIPSIITFFVYWAVAIPLGYFLSQNASTPTYYNGVNGIWIGLALGLTFSAIILTYRFYSLIRTK